MLSLMTSILMALGGSSVTAAAVILFRDTKPLERLLPGFTSAPLA